MYQIKKFVYAILLLIIGMMIKPADIYAQIKFKSPKLRIESKTGYDTNVLKVATSRDSNRIAAPVQTFKASTLAWTYWTKRLRTLFYAKGDYNYYFGNSFANTWSIQASAKSTAKLLRQKKKKWFPAIDFEFDFNYKIEDNFYSDRAFGEEFIINIGGDILQKIGAADLFDLQAFLFVTGFDIDLTKWMKFYIGMNYEQNMYKELRVDSLDYSYSLSNNDLSWMVSFSFKPISFLNIILLRDQTVRKYDQKIAKGLDGRIYPDINRKYDYTSYDLSLDLQGKNIGADLDFRYKTRTDLFEGYYNYNATTMRAKVSYNFNPRFNVWGRYQKSWKKYENLSFRGEILNNTYTLFETGFKFLYLRNFYIWPSYRYDSEGSTYYKFNYTRHRILFNIEYRI